MLTCLYPRCLLVLLLLSGYIVDPNDDPMEGVPELTEEQLNEGWEYTDPRTHMPKPGVHGGGAVYKIKRWTKNVKGVPGKQQVRVRARGKNENRNVSSMRMYFAPSRAHALLLPCLLLACFPCA